MEIRITVETTFEDGNTQAGDIGRLCRAPDKLGSESLGLHLAKAKNFLKPLQEAVLQGQTDEALNARRVCGDCGNLRPIHDDRGRILDTLYGRFQVKSPRLRQCSCQAASSATTTVFQSPLVDLFPERATVELRCLQAESGSRHSFREAARLLETFLPCAPQSNTTVRNRLGRIAEKLDVADEEHGDKNASATSSPLTVFLDGAHIDVDRNTRNGTLMLW